MENKQFEALMGLLGKIARAVCQPAVAAAPTEIDLFSHLPADNEPEAPKEEPATHRVKPFGSKRVTEEELNKVRKCTEHGMLAREIYEAGILPNRTENSIKHMQSRIRKENK